MSPRVAGSVPAIGLPDCRKRGAQSGDLDVRLRAKTRKTGEADRAGGKGRRATGQEGRRVRTRGAGSTSMSGIPLRKKRVRCTVDAGEKEGTRVKRRKGDNYADRIGGERQMEIGVERVGTRAWRGRDRVDRE